MRTPDSIVGEPGDRKKLERRHPNRPLTYFANDFLFRAVTHHDRARWPAESCAGARLTVIPGLAPPERRRAASPSERTIGSAPLLRLSAEIAGEQKILATRQKYPRHPARVRYRSPWCEHLKKESPKC
jgi:hypothetical protein